MLTYDELLLEIKRRSQSERLALLEELAHFLREELTPLNEVKVARNGTPTPEELGWPPGYFEQTYGSLKDEPLERGPQGEYEVREEIV